MPVLCSGPRSVGGTDLYIIALRSAEKSIIHESTNSSSAAISRMLSFLRQTRQLVLSNHASAAAAAAAGQPSPIYVIGNQSADLDSVISAIVYSYFFSKVALRDRSDGIVKPRPHVPLINLPDVPSGQALRRLRPEFATALWLSTESTYSSIRPEDESSVARLLTEHVVTVADVREHVRGQGNQQSPTTWDAALVDWNALPIKTAGNVRGHGSVEGLEDRITFNVVGCIDHHTEESFVPAISEEDVNDPSSQPPRVVEVGPGSCTSLVVREARHRGLWNDNSEANIHIAKLALSAILIDTGNLTAPGKVTDVDREAVAFLENVISGSSSATSSWNRLSFFEAVQHAKQHSLDFLTIDEILARDYKDWTVASGRKIGICSVVRSLPWLYEKAESENEKSSLEQSSRTGVNREPFLESLRFFALSRSLSIVSVMTAFTAAETGQFSRELLAWALDGESVSCVERFAQQAAQHLQVEPCSGTQLPPGLKIWKQRDVTKSRKQVAPLLRDACT